MNMLTRRAKLTWGSLFAVSVLASLVFAGNGPQPSVGLYWYDNADPTSPPGMSAPLNQLLVRTDSPSLYYKAGAANTAWTRIGTGGGGGGGSVTSITCAGGLNCTPVNPITTAGSIAVDLTPTTCAGGSAVTSIASNGTGSCAAFSSISGLTTNQTIKATSATTIGNAWATDNGTTWGVANRFTIDESTGATTASTLTVATGIGQPTLFSTPRAASTDGENTCIGGGCQSVAFDGVNPHSGSSNQAFGLFALTSLTTGSDNAAVGEKALWVDTSGQLNVAVGNDALQANTTGSYNTAIGDLAMKSMISDVDNTAVGEAAMTNVSVGDGNVAIGVQALQGASPGQMITHSVAVGLNAAQNLTTGAGQIVAIGYESLSSITTALAPTALGAFSLQSCTTCTASTGLGASAGPDLTTGTYNTFVGGLAGGGITTGNYNTVVGAQIGSLASGTANKIIIADGSGTASHQLWFSPTAPTSVSHGSLGAGSSNTVGNVTSIGTNTTVVLTYSNNGFPNRSWCRAQPNGTAQVVTVTDSATAPTFSCFDMAGVATNCGDFSYWCSGQ